MDENIKRAWQGKVAHLEARLQEALAGDSMSGLTDDSSVSRPE